MWPMNYKRTFIQNSAVFITIVTYKRKNILIDNISILRKSFQYAKTKYKFEIAAIVVLPNHIHMIIKPKTITDYPKITGQIKIYFTKTSELNYTSNKKRESNIWQRRYWEHTIIDEKDLNRHIDYIHYNPVKHKLVKAPKDWRSSSFRKFVKEGYYDENWYNAGDKNDIINMELE